MVSWSDLMFQLIYQIGHFSNKSIFSFRDFRRHVYKCCIQYKENILKILIEAIFDFVFKLYKTFFQFVCFMENLVFFSILKYYVPCLLLVITNCRKKSRLEYCNAAHKNMKNYIFYKKKLKIF